MWRLKSQFREIVLQKIIELKSVVVRYSVKHIGGPTRISCTRNEVVAVCQIQNGAIYIEEFMSHYLKLGVKHIVFLDNDSTDDTVDLLRLYQNVTILKTTLPYKYFNHAMKHYLVNQFARNCWSLCIDIDEFFDYPYSDVVNLDELISYLNKKSFNAVASCMLDMFPEEVSSYPKIPFRRADHKYYDTSAIEIRKSKKFYTSLGRPLTVYLGGIRKLIFGVNKISLNKYPLVLSNSGAKRRRAHHIVNAKIADFTAALFHYKFTSNFYEKVQDAINKKQYYKNSKEYRKYQAVIGGRRCLRLRQPTSKTLSNVNELIANNFLSASQGYLHYAENAQRKKNVTNPSILKKRLKTLKMQKKEAL